MTPKQQHLLNILRLVEGAGKFRTVLIGMIFPEFHQILGELRDLSVIVEKEDGVVDLKKAP